ncbi:hypothetical protein PYV61_21010, partial [Roseisolibacter sp. H3M3-2]
RALAAARAAGGGVPQPRLWRPEALAGWSAVAAVAANDFESVVFAARPDVAAAHAALAAHAAHDAAAIVRMSGSGATVFLVTDGDAPAGVVPSGGAWVETRTATRVAPVLAAG